MSYLNRIRQSEHNGDKRQEFAPGCLIWWQSPHAITRGPALLRGTFEDEGHVWAWFSYYAVAYLVRADRIVKVQECAKSKRFLGS